MRALFIDESATSSGSHYYLGGLVTDAPALRHIETEMDGLAEFIADQVDGVEQNIELHGHDMSHGKAEWEPVPLRLRLPQPRPTHDGDRPARTPVHGGHRGEHPLHHGR